MPRTKKGLRQKRQTQKAQKEKAERLPPPQEAVATVSSPQEEPETPSPPASLPQEPVEVSSSEEEFETPSPPTLRRKVQKEKEEEWMEKMDQYPRRKTQKEKEEEWVEKWEKWQERYENPKRTGQRVWVRIRENDTVWYVKGMVANPKELQNIDRRNAWDKDMVGWPKYRWNEETYHYLLKVPESSLRKDAKHDMGIFGSCHVLKSRCSEGTVYIKTDTSDAAYILDNFAPHLTEKDHDDLGVLVSGCYHMAKDKQIFQEWEDSGKAKWCRHGRRCKDVRKGHLMNFRHM